jgi:hypothetical protein
MRTPFYSRSVTGKAFRAVPCSPALPALFFLKPGSLATPALHSRKASAPPIAGKTGFKDNPGSIAGHTGAGVSGSVAVRAGNESGSTAVETIQGEHQRHQHRENENDFFHKTSFVKSIISYIQEYN